MFLNAMFHDILLETEFAWLWTHGIDMRFQSPDPDLLMFDTDVLAGVCRVTYCALGLPVLGLLACVVLSPLAPLWLCPLGYFAIIAITIRAPLFLVFRVQIAVFS